jgi:endonuclease/exonuclease/phosphatase (EEP) superfamily protein YafD
VPLQERKPLPASPAPRPIAALARRGLGAVSILSLVAMLLGALAGPWARAPWELPLARVSVLSNLLHLWVPLGIGLAGLELWARRRRLALLHLGGALALCAYFAALAEPMPALAEPAPAGEAQSGAPAGQPLALYNLNAGNSVAKWPRVAAEIEALDPDLVALEELNPAMAEGLVAALGSRFPYRALYPLGVAGRGLLSKHPIRSAALVERGGERGILECELDVHGRALRIHVVHLSLLAALEGVAEPTAQDLFDSAESLLRAAREDGVPGILVGDFNSTETSAIYGRLLELGLVDGYRLGGGGFDFSFPIGNRYPFLSSPPIVRIDHLFLTPGLSASAARLAPDAGSDHLPLYARLLFTPQG